MGKIMFNNIAYGGVNMIVEETKSNNFVDSGAYITGHLKDNPYVFPSDGYIRIICTDALPNDRYVTGFILNANDKFELYFPMYRTNDVLVIPVRKGMKFYMSIEEQYVWATVMFIGFE